MCACDELSWNGLVRVCVGKVRQGSVLGLRCPQCDEVGTEGAGGGRDEVSSPVTPGEAFANDL